MCVLLTVVSLGLLGQLGLVHVVLALRHGAAAVVDARGMHRRPLALKSPSFSLFRAGEDPSKPMITAHGGGAAAAVVAANALGQGGRARDSHFRFERRLARNFSFFLSFPLKK